MNAAGTASGRGSQRTPTIAPTARAPRRDADGAPMPPLPARSLLGAGLPARLVLVAGALALLWATILWALR